MHLLPTNKGVLPKILLNEMRDAFARSEEFLDLEVAKKDPVIEQKQKMHNAIQKATPQEMELLLEVYRAMGAGKTVLVVS